MKPEKGITLYKRTILRDEKEALESVCSLGEELTRLKFDPAEKMVDFAQNRLTLVSSIGGELVPIALQYKATESLFSRMFPVPKGADLEQHSSEPISLNLYLGHLAKKEETQND